MSEENAVNENITTPNTKVKDLCPTLDEWIERSRELSRNGCVFLQREVVEHDSLGLKTSELLELKEEFRKSGQTDEENFIRESLGRFSDYDWETHDVDHGLPVLSRD